MVESCSSANTCWRGVHVPSHLHYVFFEIFKNSMRATVEQHGDKKVLPVVKVLVCQSDHDVTVKIGDQGGGVPLESVDKLLMYLYTTSPAADLDGAAGDVPMSGLGYVSNSLS